jgi:hypothetical protein
VHIVAQTLEHDVIPTMSACFVPVLIDAEPSARIISPMNRLVAELRILEESQAILAASLPHHHLYELEIVVPIGFSKDRAKDQGFSIPGNGILEPFEMISFASIRQIAKMTFIPRTAVFRSLTKSFHFVLRRLRSVSHRLSNLQK